MMLSELLLTRFNYVVAVILIGIGVYMMIELSNLVKKVIGMNIFQSGIFLFFVTSAFLAGGSSPAASNPPPYVSPLPHVLILTAIVVGVSLTAVALGLIVRIYGEYGTLDEGVLREVRFDE